MCVVFTSAYVSMRQNTSGYAQTEGHIFFGYPAGCGRPWLGFWLKGRLVPAKR